MRARLILALVVCLALSFSGAAYGADYPRHVDPAQLALENPDPLQLFELYSQVYGCISASDYAGAGRLLASAEGIAAPAGTLSALRQYNLLLGSVIDSLNETEGGLAGAFEHLRWLREDLAEEDLVASGRRLGVAGGAAVGLVSASTSLAGLLRCSPGVLLEGVESLNRLIGDLDARILEGFLEVEAVRGMRVGGLEETYLEVAVGEAGPPVGSIVTVTGGLFDSARAGLEGRAVGLYMDGSRVGEAVTGPGGGFEYALSVPYRYVERLGLRAEYWPAGEDLGRLAPSVSGVVYLSPVFGTPVLGVEAPGVVYPGRVFRLGGVVVLGSSPVAGVAVTVRYLGSAAYAVSGVDGGFTVDLVTPDGAREGSARIAVSSASDGALGPASAVYGVEVARVPLEVAVEGPLFVFSGRDAVFAGEVRSGGTPLQGCSVKVKMGGSVYEASTDEAGVFSLGCPTGVLALSSRRGFEVVAVPVEPWVSSGSVSSGFILVNTLVAAALPLLVLAVARRRVVEPAAGLGQGQAPVAGPAVYPALPGLSGLYARAVELVGRVAGVRLRPSDTVREYLGAVRPRLVGGAYALFAWISELYEGWFYGGRGEAPLDEAGDAVERLRDEVEQG